MGEAGKTAWLVRRVGEKEGPKQVKDGHIAQSACQGEIWPSAVMLPAWRITVTLLQQPLRYRSREGRVTRGLGLLGWKDRNQGEEGKGAR